MAPYACEVEFPNTHQFFVSPSQGAQLVSDEPAQSDVPVTFSCDPLVFSGMAKVREDISEVIVKKLRENLNVKAVLMGKSGEVYHVWTMIGEWSMVARKQVYAAQRDLLSMLGGFDLDFYVVPLEEGTKPAELVSDIPVVFERAA